jgi:AraC-like DNA-binding protein
MAGNAMNTKFEFCHIGRIDPDPAWEMKRHKGAFNELIVVLNGSMKIIGQDSEEFITRPGDVFFYPADYWHEEHADAKNPTEHLYVAFYGEFDKTIRVVRDRDQRIRTIAEWLLGSIVSCSLQDVERLAHAYLVLMLEEFRYLRDHSDQSVFRTGQHLFILGNLEKPLSVDILAKRANVSPRQFLRIYRRECGCSPMVDIRRIRLENAKKLIRSTLLPLKTIAPLVGYATESELSKAFRKHYGYPPNKVRVSRRQPF